jgi:phosphoserine phosphatase
VTRFRTLLLDADSTLAGIEGIDWLAERRGPSVAAAVRALTAAAMDGTIPLEEAYARRLVQIAPTRDDLRALADAYVAAVAPDAAEALRLLRTAGVALRVISGGIREALLPLTRSLGFSDADLYAVSLQFDPDGRYAGIHTSPLTATGGKLAVVAALRPARPALAVGDGVTDLEMRPAVDAFAAFTGFARRPAIVASADREVTSFSALASWIVNAEDAGP